MRATLDGEGGGVIVKAPRPGVQARWRLELPLPAISPGAPRSIGPHFFTSRPCRPRGTINHFKPGAAVLPARVILPERTKRLICRRAMNCARGRHQGPTPTCGDQGSSCVLSSRSADAPRHSQQLGRDTLGAIGEAHALAIAESLAPGLGPMVWQGREQSQFDEAAMGDDKATSLCRQRLHHVPPYAGQVFGKGPCTRRRSMPRAISPRGRGQAMASNTSRGRCPGLRSLRRQQNPWQWPSRWPGDRTRHHPVEAGHVPCHQPRQVDPRLRQVRAGLGAHRVAANFECRHPSPQTQRAPEAPFIVDPKRLSASSCPSGGRPGASGIRNRGRSRGYAARRNRNPCSADRRSATCRCAR